MQENIMQRNIFSLNQQIKKQTTKFEELNKRVQQIGDKLSQNPSNNFQNSGRGGQFKKFTQFSEDFKKLNETLKNNNERALSLLKERGEKEIVEKSFQRIKRAGANSAPAQKTNLNTTQTQNITTPEKPTLNSQEKEQERKSTLDSKDSNKAPEEKIDTTPTKNIIQDKQDQKIDNQQTDQNLAQSVNQSTKLGVGQELPLETNLIEQNIDKIPSSTKDSEQNKIQDINEGGQKQALDEGGKIVPDINQNANSDSNTNQDTNSADTTKKEQKININQNAESDSESGSSQDINKIQSMGTISTGQEQKSTPDSKAPEEKIDTTPTKNIIQDKQDQKIDNQQTDQNLAQSVNQSTKLGVGQGLSLETNPIEQNIDKIPSSTKDSEQNKIQGINEGGQKQALDEGGKIVPDINQNANSDSNTNQDTNSADTTKKEQKININQNAESDSESGSSQDTNKIQSMSIISTGQSKVQDIDVSTETKNGEQDSQIKDSFTETNPIEQNTNGVPTPMGRSQTRTQVQSSDQDTELSPEELFYKLLNKIANFFPTSKEAERGNESEKDWFLKRIGLRDVSIAKQVSSQIDSSFPDMEIRLGKDNMNKITNCIGEKSPTKRQEEEKKIIPNLEKIKQEQEYSNSLSNKAFKQFAESKGNSINDKNKDFFDSLSKKMANTPEFKKYVKEGIENKEMFDVKEGDKEGERKNKEKIFKEITGSEIITPNKLLINSPLKIREMDERNQTIHNFTEQINKGIKDADPKPTSIKETEKQMNKIIKNLVAETPDQARVKENIIKKRDEEKKKKDSELQKLASTTYGKETTKQNQEIKKSREEMKKQEKDLRKDVARLKREHIKNSECKISSFDQLEKRKKEKDVIEEQKGKITTGEQDHLKEMRLIRSLNVKNSLITNKNKNSIEENAKIHDYLQKNKKENERVK